MERTRKVKIALGITLCLLVSAFLLRFFPVQEELAAYAPDAAVGDALCFDAVEIEYCMTYSPADGKPLNFYRLRSDDGEILLADTQAYLDETFSEPVRFTGYASLPFGEAPEQLLPRCTFDEGALSRFGGDAQAALQAFSQAAVMRLDVHAGEHPSVAFVCVSAAAMASFCTFLALLLKEYFGGKRKRAKDNEDA